MYYVELHFEKSVLTHALSKHVHRFDYRDGMAVRKRPKRVEVLKEPGFSSLPEEPEELRQSRRSSPGSPRSPRSFGAPKAPPRLPTCAEGKAVSPSPPPQSRPSSSQQLPRVFTGEVEHWSEWSFLQHMPEYMNGLLEDLQARTIASYRRGGWFATLRDFTRSVVSVVETDTTVSEARDLVLLDVRDAAEFEQCHLPLAVSYPAPKINRDQFIPELLRCKREPKLLVVYGANEQATIGVARLLVEKGWDNVHALTGGFEEMLQSYPEVLEGMAPERPVTTSTARSTRR
ncbi:unnamed protein product [Effrenium voratum]|nr:unnamed protein product [Effrenium voratum]